VSPKLFCPGLKVYHLPLALSEQDELPSSVVLDFRVQRDDSRMHSGHLEARDCLDRLSELTIDRLIDGSSCDGIDMVIEDLDLEPKVDAMMRDFLEQVLETSPCFRERISLMLLEHKDIISEFCSPSRWKELSEETSSKILPCGDGFDWKKFKPIASLIAEGKLK
nr:hypothetical protein [Tanacetum cinerariifolium]